MVKGKWADGWKSWRGAKSEGGGGKGDGEVKGEGGLPRLIAAKVRNRRKGREGRGSKKKKKCLYLLAEKALGLRG